MASCLGLYIEENLIKYAKVSKDKDFVKIEAFGVKFYDKLGDAIGQIIAETYSYKTPISLNLSEETYNYFYFFNLLNNNDMKKAIETEFESYCIEKGFNRNALETRYALVQDFQDKEKIKAIYIYANKAEINKKIQEMQDASVSMITSLPMSIPNILEVKAKENYLIVNIEAKTAITTIVDGKIYEVEKLEEGMEQILNNINMKENSYSKAYEICKNTTIYTMEGKELQEDEGLYLEDIMPTLYSITVKVKDIVEKSLNKIDKVYLTGTATVINNVDLYFQEYMGRIKCEILRPYFVRDNLKINIRDYIEVNSAIALALQGLGSGVKNLNFKKASLMDSLPDFLKIEVGGGKSKKSSSNHSKTGKKLNFNFDFSLKGALDNTERWLLRSCIWIFMLTIIYSSIVSVLKGNAEKKIEEVEAVKKDTTIQIASIQADVAKINANTTKYEQMKQKLADINSSIETEQKTKDIIPTLLSELMAVIPQGVTLTSVENTTSTHIVINAESNDYNLLGIFKGTIIKDGILSPSTVVSTSGVKQDNTVKIVIEGELP